MLFHIDFLPLPLRELVFTGTIFGYLAGFLARGLCQNKKDFCQSVETLLIPFNFQQSDSLKIKLGLLAYAVKCPFSLYLNLKSLTFAYIFGFFQLNGKFFDFFIFFFAFCCIRSCSSTFLQNNLQREQSRLQISVPNVV